MKRKLLIKSLVTNLLVLTMFFPCYTAYAQQPITNPISKEESQIGKANRYVWKYKEINGKIYKRLYDLTENRWIGDWILV